MVAGSGNGACGLLNQWQATAPADARALVLEEGRNFFFTSDVTTQDNALRAWSQNKIFQLHDARTPKRRPIISGRARTHGGGGSINYTMARSRVEIDRARRSPRRSLREPWSKYSAEASRVDAAVATWIFR